MTKNRQFKIIVPKLPDVSALEWKEYIADAVGGWKGQFHPDTPLFALDSDEVKCVSFVKPKPPINKNAATEDMLRTALAQLERVLESETLAVSGHRNLEREIRGFLGQPK